MSSNRQDYYRGNDEKYDRRKRRSRSRSNSRDRKKQQYNNKDQGRNTSENNRSNISVSHESSQPNKANDSATIVIKGLPSHTTESTLYAVLALYSPKEIRLIALRDGECKGYAFVEFVSLEHAQYFMFTFAGSSGGDSNAAQFIVDNRAVLLEYAREGGDKTTSKEGGNPRYLGSNREGKKPYAPRSDWLCASCTCHNFAKRDLCFRCSAARTEQCLSVTSGNGSGDSAESVVSSDSPSVYLVARGFGLATSDAQVMDVFRQFAVVKSLYLLRDPSVGHAKAMAFLEFHTVDHAAYVVQNAANIRIDAVPLKVSYARENVMSQLIQQSQQPGSILSLQPAVVAPSPSQHWSAYGAQMQQQQQQQLVLAGYDANGMPIMTDSSSTAMYGGGYPQQQQQLDQNQQYALQHQMMAMQHAAAVAAAAAVKPTIRFPPHFETQGGKYVFQPKSGCFLEPLSEFYFCPRSKLYYCAKDGTYFFFDASLDPPFKRFEPPAPIEPEDSLGGAVDVTSPTAEAATATLSFSSAAPALLGQLSGGALRTPLTLSLGGIGVSKPAAGKGGTGGLLSSTVGGAGKRLKSDLLKWGALQADDDDEAEEQGEDSQKCRAGRIQRAAPRAVAASAPSAALLTTAELALLTKGSVVEPVVSAHPSSALDRIVASIPPSAPVTDHVVVVAAVAAVVGPAVCLLCRRQFASPEMLQRHERESKLHADNLRQSLLLAATPQQTSSDDAVSGEATSGVESSSSSAPPPPPPPVYRNRALERRENQEGSGDNSSLAAVGERGGRRGDIKELFSGGGRGGFGDVGRGETSFRSLVSRDITSPPASAAVPVAVFQDASNVGNALLRKMGWTDGSGLGRDGTGREEAVGVELAAGVGKRGSMHATAAAGSATSNSLYQYKEGSYKESLLSATRARFEQIAKK